MRLSALWLVFVIAGALVSAFLPAFETGVGPPDSLCYWTNQLVGLVVCSPETALRRLHETFYNAWLWYLYVPLFVVSGGPAFTWGVMLLLYLPLAILATAAWRRLRP